MQRDWNLKGADVISSIFVGCVLCYVEIKKVMVERRDTISLDVGGLLSFNIKIEYA